MSASDFSSEKRALRGRLLTACRQISASERSQLSTRICDRLMSLEPLQAAEHIVLFRPLEGEVNIAPLWEQLAAQGKRLYLPRLEPGRTLSFCPWQPGDPLTTRAFGLEEPSPLVVPADPASLQAWVVPGVAFDRQGVRLGRGAGYYDRSLPGARPGVVRIGVCFDLQHCVTLPVESWDCRMDMVATDQGIFLSEPVLPSS